jgi:hypothetical protein
MARMEEMRRVLLSLEAKQASPFAQDWQRKIDSALPFVVAGTKTT